MENYQYYGYSIGEKWVKDQFSPIEGGYKRMFIICSRSLKMNSRK